MKVVADTHASPSPASSRLTDTALDALLEAEKTDGVVSAATRLWYASQNTSSAIAPGVHEQIRATILDPTTNLVLCLISAAMMTHFGSVPLADLRDPFDRFILATAMRTDVAWSPPTTPSPTQSTPSGDGRIPPPYRHSGDCRKSC